MPTISDITWYRQQDGNVLIPLMPPAPVGGQTIRFEVLKRPDSDAALFTKYCASGYGGGASGITVASSGQGQLRVRINSADTSGLDPGCYAYRTDRLDSGSWTPVNRGHFILEL